MKTERGRNEFVGSFAKGLELLKAFGPQRRTMTLSEAALATGQSRASARRFLLTLVALGYARQNADAFSLTQRVLELGHHYLAPHTVGEVAQPLLFDVATKLGETASVAILAGNTAEIVAYARANRQMSLNLMPGDCLPLFSSAQGRALLTGLPDGEIETLFSAARIGQSNAKARTTFEENLDAIHKARRLGYVVIDEELEAGVRSIAMPIRDTQGKVIAAMSTCAHSNRASVEELVEVFKPVLSKTVNEIERTLRILSDI